jgi:hypothetical protein
MSGPPSPHPPPHPHHRRRDSLATLTTSSLTTDDLNKASLGRSFANTGEEQQYFSSLRPGGNSSAAALPDIAVGRVTYTFTKGDAGVPHFYTAEVTENGKIMGGKLGYMRDSETIVPTALGPNVTEQFEEFARKDIKNARARNPGQYAQVSRDISQANDYHGKILLDRAGESDLKELMKQQRMPKDPSMKLGGLY